MDSLIYGNIVSADLDKPFVRKNVGLVMASGDELANRYGAQLHRSGVDADASAYSVVGYLIRPNDETLKIHGVASGNTVYVDIPKTGYVYDGAFTLTVKVYGDGFEKAVAIFDGQIAKTTTETIVDGERVVISVDEIFKQIDAMEKAEADANAAASSANTAAGNANAATTNANNAASRANAAAAAIEGLTVSSTDVGPSTPASAEVNTVDGVHNIHFNLRQGQTGATPNIRFNVATGAPGTDVQISQSGTAENPVVNLTIPRGTPGEGAVSTVNGVQPDTAGNVQLAPDDVGALPSSGTAANASLLGGKAPEYYVQPYSWVDNGNFANVVNQRGLTTYNTSDWNKYCIDRWRRRGDAAVLTVTVNPGKSITVSKGGGTGSAAYGLLHSIGGVKELLGKTVTFAVKILSTTFSKTRIAISDGATSDGVGITLNKNDTTGAGIHTVTATIPETLTNGYLNVLFWWGNDINDGAGKMEVEWAALYEGTYTADTLPPYVPKGYSAELAECMRYCFAISKNTLLNGFITGSSKEAWLTVSVPSQMRLAEPTVSVLPSVVMRTASGYSTLTPSADTTLVPSSAAAVAESAEKASTLRLRFFFDSAIGTNNTLVSVYITSECLISADL